MSHDSRRPTTRLSLTSGIASPPPTGTNSPYILLTLVGAEGTPYLLITQPSDRELPLCGAADSPSLFRSTSNLGRGIGTVNLFAMSPGLTPLRANPEKIVDNLGQRAELGQTPGWRRSGE